MPPTSGKKTKSIGSHQYSSTMMSRLYLITISSLKIHPATSLLLWNLLSKKETKLRPTPLKSGNAAQIGLLLECATKILWPQKDMLLILVTWGMVGI